MKKLEDVIDKEKERMQKEIWDSLSFDEMNNSGIKGSDNPPYRNLEEGWCLRRVYGKLEKIQAERVVDGWYSINFETDPQSKSKIFVSVLEWGDMDGPVEIMSAEGKTYIGGRYVYEHRLLMERKIGRLLRKEEVVHHRNGNKLDNRLKNLEIKTKTIHTRDHQKPAQKVELFCLLCGNAFFRRKSDYDFRVRSGQKHFYCSQICQIKDQKNQRLPGQIT